jgi:hypothetical protein
MLRGVQASDVMPIGVAEIAVTLAPVHVIDTVLPAREAPNVFDRVRVLQLTVGDSVADTVATVPFEIMFEFRNPS